jgi:protein-disulfide isomerase
MSEKVIHRVAIILSMISIIAVLLWVKVVTSKMDNIASMQFGWPANYELAKKLFTSDKFKEQQQKQLQWAIDQIAWAPAAQDKPDTQWADKPAQPAAPTTEQFPSGKLTPDQLVAIKKDAVIEWDKKAKVTIIEYSDLECPFCIRHFNDKTVANTVAAFPWSVNHIFKPVQWVNHPGTEYKSLAVLCAGKLKGDDAFVGLYNKIFAASSTSAAVPTAKISEFASELKINTSDLEECITKGDTKAIYAANWAEFKTLTSSPGTPGNIILNNETGEWKLIAGAYPVDTFKQLIGAWTK